jgi:CBS domain-containing protein
MSTDATFVREGTSCKELAKLLASLRVWQLMHPGPLVVAADQPLTEAACLLDRHHLDMLAVVDGHGQPVGVLTTSDLIHALAG